MTKDKSAQLQDEALSRALDRVEAALRGRRGQLATAESCTGGLVGAACTERAGSSDWYWGGWVTYDNDAKERSLGVTRADLALHGAVSEAVACAMAEGALQRSSASVALAVTGVAGPGGGSALKPVGLVWMAVALSGHPVQCWCHRFEGSRADVRQQAVVAVLDHVADTLGVQHPVVGLATP